MLNLESYCITYYERMITENRLNSIFLIVATILITIFQGCITKPVKELKLKEEFNNESPTKRKLIDLKPKFKYADLKTFDLKKMTVEDFEKNFSPVDSNDFKLIFQNAEAKKQVSSYNTNFYYSWQKQNNNFTAFTIATVDEESSCILLKYYIFDDDGKHLGNFDIASRCGDGGWALNAVGKQLNKSNFSYLMIEDESDLNEDSLEGDSTLSMVKIDSKGNINSKEVYKRHFKHQK